MRMPFPRYGCDPSAAVKRWQQEDTDNDGVGNACDIAAGCTTLPRTSCRTTMRRQSKLLVRDGAVDEQDLLTWRWRRGTPPTPLDAFGNPTVRDAYAVCVYEGTDPTLALGTHVAAGGVCMGSLRERRASQPCWTRLRNGFRHENVAATPQG
jgi:hypothetical protein